MVHMESIAVKLLTRTGIIVAVQCGHKHVRGADETGITQFNAPFRFHGDQSPPDQTCRGT